MQRGCRPGTSSRIICPSGSSKNQTPRQDEMCLRFIRENTCEGNWGRSQEEQQIGRRATPMEENGKKSRPCGNVSKALCHRRASGIPEPVTHRRCVCLQCPRGFACQGSAGSL